MSTKTVQDDVSRFGLRRVHKISYEPLAMSCETEPGWRVVARWKYEEAEIGVHHLWVFMKTTETPGSEPG